MVKLIKVKFEDGNQTLDVPDDVEVVANLFADLSGTILLVKTIPPQQPAVIPEVVNPPADTGLGA